MLRAAVTLYDALLGFALLFAPWSRLWQDNWLFWHAGSLQSYVMSGPVRGAVSGFGAAFLIRAAGRLAGITLVEEDGGATRATPPDPAPRPAARADAPAPGEAAGSGPGGVAPAGIRER